MDVPVVKEEGGTSSFFTEDTATVLENISQQVYSATWEIHEFKRNFHRYLENSSKDGTELCPIRNYFIETGEKIGLPCKWIAGLYLFPLDADANNNEPKFDENFNLKITMRLVELPKEEPGIFSNCRFTISTVEGKEVFQSKFTRIREVELQKEYGLEGMLMWSKWHKFFDMNSTFCCTFEQLVYNKSPVEPGLSQLEQSVITVPD